MKDGDLMLPLQQQQKFPISLAIQILYFTCIIKSMSNKLQRKNSYDAKQDLIEYAQQSFYGKQLRKVGCFKGVNKIQPPNHKRVNTQVMPNIECFSKRLKTIEDRISKQKQAIFSKDYRYNRNTRIKKLSTLHKLQIRQKQTENSQSRDRCRNLNRAETKISYSTAINRRSLLAIPPVNLSVFCNAGKVQQQNVDKKFKPSIASSCIPNKSPFYFKIKTLPQIQKLFRFKHNDKTKCRRSATKVLIIKESSNLSKRENQLLFEDRSF